MNSSLKTVSRMFTTDYKTYDFFDKGVEKWTYDKDIIGGIEIETCVREGLFEYDNGWEEDFYPYEDVDDTSIKCKNGEAVEYITHDPYPIVDILNPETEVGNATERIMKSEDVYACAKNTNGLVSCGTHVHMSNPRLTMLKYPHFDKVMRYLWIQYYQPYCIHRFYKFQDRDKNEDYSKISTHVPRGKYEMFNIRPSYRGLPPDKYEREIAISEDPNRSWHFEFRGYGEMRTGWTDENPIAKEYLQILMNLWYEAELYYKMKNVAEVDRARIIKYPATRLPVTKLPLLYYIRKMVNPDIEETIEAIREFDKPNDSYYRIKLDTQKNIEYMHPNRYFNKLEPQQLYQEIQKRYDDKCFQLILTHEFREFDFTDYAIEEILPFATKIQTTVSLPGGFYLIVYKDDVYYVDVEDYIPDIASDIEELIEDENQFTDIDIMWKTVQRYTMVYQLHFGYNRFGYARPKNKKRKRSLHLKF